MAAPTMTWPSPPPSTSKPKIWWSNGIFFIAFHLLSLYGAIYLAPWSSISWKTVTLWFMSWQFASFGITIGYHRLWSHQAFEAALPVRIVLACMGCLGFQGSIRWWVLRHRLHHRFTDDPIHDPYSASRGLFWSHCGWIFFKPTYERMKDIDREDLDADPVVRFQHAHFVEGALFLGLVVPTLLGASWGEPLAGLVWGGGVARICIFHATFCINSLAHWTGLQPYTDEISARGNYLLALLTSGEGNHNYHHAFPSDYKNGPNPQDWDPTKWIIWSLHKLFPSLVPSLKRTPPDDVLRAQAAILRAQADALDAQADGTLDPSSHSHHHHHHHYVPPSEFEKRQTPLEKEQEREKDLPVWSWDEVRRRAGEGIEEGEELYQVGKERRWLIVIDGWVVDVGGYLANHPGGPALLQTFAIPPLPNLAGASSSHYSRTFSSSSSSQGSSSSLSSDSGLSSAPTSPRSSDFSPSWTSTSDEIEIDHGDSRHSAKADILTKRVISRDLKKKHAGEEVDAGGTEWKKDASAAFNGEVNRHSRRARLEMLQRRVAKLTASADD